MKHFIYSSVLSIILVSFLSTLSYAQFEFTPHDIADFMSAGKAIPIDMDNDNDLDIVAYSCAPSTYNLGIFWWEQVNPQTWTQHIISIECNSGHDIDAGDFDLDGDIDIIGNNGYLGFVQLQECTGNNSWSTTMIDTNCSVVCERFVDIDGDLDLDLLLGYSAGVHGVRWFEQTETEGWIEHMISGLFQTVTDIIGTDIDGDGDIDAIASANNSHQVCWWEQTEADVWVEHLITDSAYLPHGLCCADIDGDSDDDLVVAAYLDDRVFWFEMVDADNWIEHEIPESLNGACSVDVADIDNDGDMDIAGTSYYSSFVIFEQTSPDIWVRHVISTDYSDIRSVKFIDLNNDGYLDMVTASMDDDVITWWESDLAPHLPPSEFSLLVPADEDTIWATPATFTWQSSIDGDSGQQPLYDIYRSNSPDMSNAVLMASDIADTTVEITQLFDDHIYYWTVYAQDNNTQGTWASDTFELSTYYPEPPENFNLISPEDEASIPRQNAFPLTFIWENAADPDPNDIINYTLELSSDLQFENPNTFEAGTNTSYEISNLEGTLYWWRVIATDLYGNQNFSYTANSIMFTSDTPETGNTNIPERFSISKVYPNPFNPTLNIEIALPYKSTLNVSIYNIYGQQAGIISSGTKQAGYHTFTFDGHKLSSGIYFVNATFDDNNKQVKKVILTK